MVAALVRSEPLSAGYILGFTLENGNVGCRCDLRNQTVALKTAEIAKKPLEGLDSKLTAATVDADKFYEKRLPVAYSDVLAELGALTNKQGVKLTRVQYAEERAVPEGARWRAARSAWMRALTETTDHLSCFAFAGTGQDVLPDQRSYVDRSAEVEWSACNRLATYLRGAKGRHS